MFVPLTQFSIFLTSKPGILSNVCRTLADAKINLIAVTLMDSVEHGVFRIVAGDTKRTRDVLKTLNVPLTESDVLKAELSNRPGALADICARLNSEHISIKYAYVTSGAAGGRTTAIFKVDNMSKALGLNIGDDKKDKKKEKQAQMQRHRAAPKR